MTITAQERQLVHDTFSQGPSALLDAGYTQESLLSFLGRADVLAEIALLNQELQHQSEIDARSKFLTRRTVARMGPGALAVMARALAGPVYLRDPKTGAILQDGNGKKLIAEAAPTGVQMRAAETVLDQIGVTRDKTLPFVDPQGGFDPRKLLGSADEVVDADFDIKGLTEEQKALSREKVRNVIETLCPRIDEARENMKQEQDEEAKRVTARRKPVKKAVKKPARRVARKKAKNG